MTSRLAYFNMSFPYSATGRTTSSVCVQVEKVGSTTINFDADETAEIEALIWTLVERKKHRLAEGVLAVATPALITSGVVNIDADDIPF